MQQGRDESSQSESRRAVYGVERMHRVCERVCELHSVLAYLADEVVGGVESCDIELCSLEVAIGGSSV